MSSTFLSKQEKIKDLFSKCLDAEAKYGLIIEMGRKVPALDPELKVPEKLVPGCQSIMHLHAELKEGTMRFFVESDALISAGLAALLIEVYNGETPESMLTSPPIYLEELGISASLTPNRANGLYSIHLKMKQEALRLLLQR